MSVQEMCVQVQVLFLYNKCTVHDYEVKFTSLAETLSLLVNCKEKISHAPNQITFL